MIVHSDIEGEQNIVDLPETEEELNFIDHPEIEDELNKKVLIKGNKTLLEIALENIVRNAEKHAFVETNTNFKLEFRVGIAFESNNSKGRVKKSNDNSDYIIKVEVSNNGKPFQITTRSQT